MALIAIVQPISKSIKCNNNNELRFCFSVDGVKVVELTPTTYLTSFLYRLIAKL